MDPNENYRQLLAALESGDSDSAADLADSLRHWLQRGGFLPAGAESGAVWRAITRGEQLASAAADIRRACRG
jgi:hypothetical protein